MHFVESCIVVMYVTYVQHSIHSFVCHLPVLCLNGTESFIKESDYNSEIEDNRREIRSVV